MVPDDRHLARHGLLDAAFAELPLELPEGGQGRQACRVLPGLRRDQMEEGVARSSEDEVAEPLGLLAPQLGEDRLNQRLVGVGPLRAVAVADELMGHGKSPHRTRRTGRVKGCALRFRRDRASFPRPPASSGHERCAARRCAPALEETMLLAEKVAVLYGASGNVGRAVARAFAREGATVFLTGRDRPSLESLAGSLGSEGGKAEAAVVDTVDEQAIERHLDGVMEKTGRV